ncbi:MFS transporter [Nocardioides litoris]|uniref:MFS transporter n=1 Tax=Nocardioides litoris TaxID=1926648 RepID=UPI00111F4E05|nr:MFS transporter [Nocardioides litoris]
MTSRPDDSRRVSLLLGLLFGLAGMGSSSAAVAVPLIAEDFGTGAGTATWTISLYALMLAVTTAVYGRVSDLVGIRLPLLVGTGLMTAGAVLAALAPTFEVLLVARLVQGAGAAAVPTLGVAVLNGRYAGSTRGLALGRLAGVAAAVSCLGPLAGGLVEHAFGWRAVMALPVLGLVVLPVLWPALTRAGSGARLDLLGAVLVALTAAGVVLLVQSPSTGAAVAVAGLLLVALGTPATVSRVRRRPHGFLPLEVVRNGVVVRSAAAAAAVPAAWFALLVGVPAVLVGAGWEPWQVGLLLLPSSALALLVPRYAGRAIDRFGPARAIAVAGVVSTVALLVAALGAGLTSGPLLGLGVLMVTVAFGVGQPAMTASVADAVEPDVRGVALGVATLVFLVGGSVGSAVIGGLGDVLGIDWALVLLALLPLLGLAVLARELTGDRKPAYAPVD